MELSTFGLFSVFMLHHYDVIIIITKGVYTLSEKRACNSHSNCTDISVTKNSNIAQVRAYRTLTLKNFDGCTSCMPSSPKEYIRPCYYTTSMYMCTWPWGIILNHGKEINASKHGY